MVIFWCQSFHRHPSKEPNLLFDFGLPHKREGKGGTGRRQEAWSIIKGTYELILGDKLMDWDLQPGKRATI